MQLLLQMRNLSRMGTFRARLVLNIGPLLKSHADFVSALTNLERNFKKNFLSHEAVRFLCTGYSENIWSHDEYSWGFQNFQNELDL